MLNQFLGDVLPPTGYYCLTLLPEGRHLWAENTDELAELVSNHDERDGVYFGTAAFRTIANRKQDNVLALKSLRLDIDAGEKKYSRDPAGTYPTQQDALASLIAFIKATELKPTYIISSGEGLHVYYCAKDEMVPGRWLGYAKALGDAASRHGLRIDCSVTEDSARILRPLGALHANGKRVSVIKYTGVFYEANELDYFLPALAPVRKYDLSVNAELDLAYQGPPSSAFKIAQHCGALREVAQAKGDVPEPFWRAMLGLVKRTVEADDVAHEWSTGYDGYDPTETQRKFDAWSTGPTTCQEFSRHSTACNSCEYKGKVKSPINLGLMTAEQIEELPEEDRPAPPAPAVVIDNAPWGLLPQGYEVIKDKEDKLVLVQNKLIEKPTETGEVVPAIIQIPFTRDIFWLGTWAEADNSDDTAQVTVHLLAKGYVKRYQMDQGLFASQHDLLKWLAGKSIMTTTHKKAPVAMQDYVKESLDRIRDSHKRPKIADHLGIRTTDDDQLVVAHGHHVIYPDGTIKQATLSSNLRSVADQFVVPLPKAYTGEWSADVWNEHIIPRAEQHVAFLRKYYATPGMERFALAIMMGLASPLMTFVRGEWRGGPTLPKMSSLTVSLFSRESARGKTTACMAAVLAYGRPSDLTNDSGNRGATDNGRIGRLSFLGTMPNVMDEMGGATARSVSDMVSAVANGSGKMRVRQNGDLNTSAPWALINLLTTNTSQRDMISAVQSNSDAIQQRLLEINVDDMPEYSAEQRRDFTADWADVNDNCVGALGALIHREISRQGVTRVSRLVTECVNRAVQKSSAAQNARFQYHALGACIALHVLLNRLGMSPFDLDAVIEQFKIAHDSGQEYVADNFVGRDGIDLLVRCLLDMAPHTIVTDTETHRTRTVTKYDVPLNNRIPDKVYARHVKSVGRTYIAVDAVKNWCAEHGMTYQEIVRAARKAGIIVLHSRSMRPRDKTVDTLVSAEKYNLTKGMKDTMELRTRCFTIDTAKLAEITGRDIETLADKAVAESK